jgi:mannose-1-phosphate guanylyltransferase
MNQDLYVVIMAGGIGSRFWPMSTSEKPKQFQDFLGTGKSLLRMTFDRFSSICPPERILVVTNQSYTDLVKDEIEELPEKNIIAEPFRRNTAPCIALASLRIESESDNATVIVSPADHLILEQDIFKEAISSAIVAADEENLVTIGIKPTRPDTGYGYIHFANGEHLTRDVISFTEKPDLSKAEQFLKSGEYYWNSGMFIWKNNTILKSFETFIPELLQNLRSVYTAISTNDSEGIAAVFGNCEDISIDYGVMEKAKKVKVVLGSFTWTDLGTWGSVYDQLAKDEQTNAILGENIQLFGNSNENLIVNGDSQKMIAVMSTQNLIIVNTEKALLVCDKDSEQGIREIVKSLS